MIAQKKRFCDILETYDLYALNVQLGPSEYGHILLKDENVNSVDFGALSVPHTINGNSYRYIRVDFGDVRKNLKKGDSWQLSVGAVGDLKYSISKADGDVITGLYVKGTPTGAKIVNGNAPSGVNDPMVMP
ncbi:hypothetical protein HZA39_02340 [Candidatus Peregrinibacteria bacterium]|nr:hypothetical protein [Candidatus Peregrinibacteria bacterium]